jgi:lipoate-protein ligase A
MPRWDTSICLRASNRNHRSVPVFRNEWRVLLEGGRSAAEQMARDEALAQEALLSVRLFFWDPPAVSLGWKQPCPEWVQPPRRRGAGLQLVERPTGGGVAFHGSDLSVSVVVPRTLGLRLETLMGTICQSAVRLCRTYGVQATPLLDATHEGRITCCLAQQSPYAVLSGERKMAGFALRRYPESWLMQGSLLVQPLPEALKEAMPASFWRRLEARAVPLSEAANTSVTEREAAQRWAQHWPSWWFLGMRQERCDDHHNGWQLPQGC